MGSIGRVSLLVPVALLLWLSALGHLGCVDRMQTGIDTHAIDHHSFLLLWRRQTAGETDFEAGNEGYNETVLGSGVGGVIVWETRYQLTDEQNLWRVMSLSEGLIFWKINSDVVQ